MEKASASKFIFGITSLLLLSFASVPAVHAQSVMSGIVVSWSASTYTPPVYKGKALPTSKSKITAWATLFNNGQPVSLANYSLQWFADGNMIQAGTGLQKITFTAPTDIGVFGLQVRAQNALGSQSVGNIQVAVVPAKVAIQGSYPGNVISNPTAHFAALPYFFNVSDPSSLSFAWTVNGISALAAENPDQADVNIGGLASGAPVNVQLKVSNSTDQSAASASTLFTYQKI